MTHTFQAQDGWRDQYQREAFANFENFVQLLASVNAFHRGIDPALNQLRTETPSVMGPGRQGLPETILYLPPRPSEVAMRLEQLRSTCLTLQDPADRAALVNIGLQLLHPYDDANKRTGRSIHRILTGEAKADPRFLVDEIRRCNDIDDGAMQNGEFEGIQRGPALYLLGRFQLFSTRFGRAAASAVIGLAAPGFDELEMRLKGELAATIINNRGSFTEEDKIDFVLHALASQHGFNPFKLAVLELLCPSGKIEASPFLDLKPYDDKFTMVHLKSLGGLLAGLSDEHLRVIINRSWQLAGDYIDHLNFCFTNPEQTVHFEAPEGTSLAIKNHFKDRRGGL